MENTEKKETEKKQTEEKELEITEKFPKKLLSEQLDIYCKSVNMETYAKFGFIVFPILVLIHNIFIAGNSYDYKTYEAIKTTELSIVFILMSVFIVLGVMVIIFNNKLNNSLTESAKKYGMEIELVEEEFSILSVYLYGGRGVKLKKKKER